MKSDDFVTVLFGGTFNPFHSGHYEMLAALERQPQVGKILVMPDRIPPHKVCDFLARDDERIAMCRLAAEDFRKADVCLIEFERQGKSYTYDTVLALKQKYPNAVFRMACGGDMIATLDTWHEWRSLIAEIGFYAFRRQGSDFDTDIARLRKCGADIIVMNDLIPTVSSTELRVALRAGNCSGLIPEKIYRYITEKGVYDGNNNT